MNGRIIDKFCVNPVTNTFVINYNDGTWQDTNIQTSCNSNSNSPCFSAGKICTPKAPNTFINTIQYTEDNEMIIGYSDGNICSLGTICKCTNVLFGDTDYPGCCPNAKCGDVFINLNNGNTFKFYGRNWDLIGNIGGPTGSTGIQGPTGNGIQTAIIDENSNLILTYTNGQIQNAGTIIGPTGPTGAFITNSIVDEHGYLLMTYSNNNVINSGYVLGPTGPTGIVGPTGTVTNYTGTGFFGFGFMENMTHTDAINALCQPWTYYPTFFGTGIVNGSNPLNNPSSEAVIIGNRVDSTGPNNANYTVSIGYQTGQMYQQSGAVAIGYQAGYTTQGTGSVAIGYLAGQISQDVGAVSIGVSAGQYNQQSGAIAIGNQAGYAVQGSGSISIGNQSGYTKQESHAVAIGYQSGYTTQGTGAISIGYQAGFTSQASGSIAIGVNSGFCGQGLGSVAIGTFAGATGQGQSSVAIGYYAGATKQGSYSVAIGQYASYYPQSSGSVSIGYQAGYCGQNAGCVAIGIQAGITEQGTGSIAIGYQAGQTGLGTNSIAIGYQAGPTSGAATTANTLYTITGLTTMASVASLQYDTTTGQIGPPTSTIRAKTNIQPLTEDYTRNVFNLQPVSFDYKNGLQGSSIGLIAEEVVKYFPEIVPVDSDGLPYSINYDLLSVLLLDRIQRMEKQIDEHDLMIQDLLENLKSHKKIKE